MRTTHTYFIIWADGSESPEYPTLERAMDVADSSPADWKIIINRTVRVTLDVGIRNPNYHNSGE